MSTPNKVDSSFGTSSSIHFPPANNGYLYVIEEKLTQKSTDRYHANLKIPTFHKHSDSREGRFTNESTSGKLFYTKSERSRKEELKQTKNEHSNADEYDITNYRTGVELDHSAFESRFVNSNFTFEKDKEKQGHCISNDDEQLSNVSPKPMLQGTDDRTTENFRQTCSEGAHNFEQTGYEEKMVK